jgi:choline dehydrogenase
LSSGRGREPHDAAPEAGFPVLDHLNDLSSPEGAAHVPVNANGFARWNAAFAYLDGARARDNLTVIGDALVDRVLVDGRRARGAVALVAGEPVDLGAELVIVSAGAFRSPGVLMRSGIGAGEQLAGLGIAIVLNLPGVGANLQDHCGITSSVGRSRSWSARTRSPRGSTGSSARCPRCADRCRPTARRSSRG